VHTHKGNSYLSYAYQFPEKTACAMSRRINGHWQYKGILNELTGNSNTKRQAIINLNGKPYFIYHTGGIQPSGGSFRHSVAIDELMYNPDGTLKGAVITTEGVQPVKAR